MSKRKSEEREISPETLGRMSKQYRPEEKDELDSETLFRLLMTLVAKQELTFREQTFNDKQFKAISITKTLKELNSSFYVANNEGKEELVLFDSENENPKKALIFTRVNANLGNISPESSSFKKMQIYHNPRCIRLHQEELIKRIIDDKQTIDMKHLIAVAMGTRPDICGTVDMMQNYPFLKLKVTHDDKYFKNLCKHLENSKEFQLHIEPSTEVEWLNGFSDAAIADINNFHPTKQQGERTPYSYQKGCIIYSYGVAVSWCSKKQDSFDNNNKVFEPEHVNGEIIERDIDSLERMAQFMVIETIGKIYHFLVEIQFAELEQIIYVRADNINNADLKLTGTIDPKSRIQKYGLFLMNKEIIKLAHVPRDKNEVADMLSRHLHFKKRKAAGVLKSVEKFNEICNEINLKAQGRL